MILAMVVAVALLASIALGTYFTLEILGWNNLKAGLAVGAFNLALAAVLIRRLFPASSGWQAPVRRSPQPLPPRPMSEYQARRVAYQADAAARLACEHLRHVEDAMRKAGVPVDYASESSLYAQCRINADLLEIQEPVRYIVDSTGREPDAQLFCSACRYRIGVVHPGDQYGVLFPAGPRE